MEQSESNPTGAIVAPISLATTFCQAHPGQAAAANDANSFGLGFEYSRTGNPTRGAFERAVAAAEGAKHGIAFSSGSAATSAVVHLLTSGNRILCVDDVYGGTQRYFRRIVSPQMGISIDFVDFHDHEAVQELLSHETKLLWLETPTNPTLKVTDIAETAALAHKVGALLAVDNTFCSPYFQNPLEHGADIVVHSVTKYINGHSDVVMGVVCCNNDDLYRRLKFIQNGVGAVPSPFDCYLALRGLKTLHLRMEAAARNAHAVALFLEQHPGVVKVLYPGLPSHPEHDLACQQQIGFGAMVTFYCKGTIEQASIILKSLRMFSLAESLGAVESLAESPALMTHASVPPDQRNKLGIDGTLIRLSVGIESCQDLIDDLERALNMAFHPSSLSENGDVSLNGDDDDDGVSRLAITIKDPPRTRQKTEEGVFSDHKLQTAPLHARRYVHGQWDTSAIAKYQQYKCRVQGCKKQIRTFCQCSPGYWYCGNHHQEHVAEVAERVMQI